MFKPAWGDLIAAAFFGAALLGTAAWNASSLRAQSGDAADTGDRTEAARRLARPLQPGGLLSDLLGEYFTIEGVPYEGGGKVETNSLVVDTVNGAKLDKPLLVLVKNTRLPPKRRCVLKGYELGEMIGTPPALYAAAKEQGRELEHLSATAWRWRPYFVALVVVEPKD